jgi:hypothetical protein
VGFDFKIWDQANDGQTMAIRVDTVDELLRLSAVSTGPDIAGNWENLRDYLDHAAAAAAEPVPYVRHVDILWQLDPDVVVPSPYSQNRRFRVTYTGRVRTGGGFASQGYCVVDPMWNAALQPHHQRPIQVEWHRGENQDLLVVGPR